MKVIPLKKKKKKRPTKRQDRTGAEDSPPGSNREEDFDPHAHKGEYEQTGEGAFDPHAMSR